MAKEEIEARPEESKPGLAEKRKFMNRLRMLLMTIALMTGCSALASAQEYRAQEYRNDGGRYEFRDHDRDRREDRYRYNRFMGREDRYRGSYGDHDRRYLDRGDRWRDRDYRGR